MSELTCEACLEELPAYLRGELTEAEAEAVCRHLQACPACRAESEETGRVQEFLRHCLPRRQAPDAFLSRLRARMDREGVINPTERDTAAASSPVRLTDGAACSRRLFGERRTLRSRLSAAVRRSPYLAASLALHGAAAALVVVLLIRLQSAPEQKIVTTGPADPATTFQIREINAAWVERRDCPKVTVQGVQVAEGVLIDCPQLLTEGELALVDSPDLACIKGYLPAAGAVGRKAVVKDARVVIPADLAHKRLGSDATVSVKVLELTDRVEFWAESRWNAFAGQQTSANAELRNGTPMSAQPPVLVAENADFRAITTRSSNARTKTL